MPSKTPVNHNVEVIFRDPVRLVKTEIGEKIPGAVFRMELNSFSIPRESPKWPGKKLRFTITWRLDIPPVNPEIGDVAEELGCDIEGCVARVNKFGELIWSPPQARSGNYYANVLFVTPRFYKRVQEGLTRSKYFDILKPLITENPDKMAALKALDPEVPERIEV